ncbi:DNA topoisomerase IV subunit A [Ligilactobacillus animalis]|uniref:DNA topoisomerase IV subunit A n=1 Tax=Ligilactobacillus animalis TaxID=1605 RepID=UPI00082552F1|nr:DNA topoisomerase IV subunit A [Ligilactobacillus animalis]MDO5882884.1 DNA topoisomerase IV subunit A [Ligilactobacillus animalis]MDQ2233691.1 DNA topoisomerase IV subunit A [Ligilactobacillus animalis]MDU1487384.1 DNA topoisomerase IV subunit A [Ligilactobacillus animalis]MDU8985898.1 DNA topoisomerase IV subunit A [Ligilactobacillus animalis]OCX47699.1 DNA topoisomerase IV subunit A [Ligilactobacillus animalis]
MSEQNIQELSLEAVMGERFGRYSKYIIQERALPDIRDGLKPVQRRILFAMHEDKNTFDKPFRKSAKSVGNVMGNFHPHGDSSIYEAMVRLSQDWKLREPLIEMHGNNGSMDGDPPAAMRYTEARLSEIAAEMLKDIDKKTVDMVLNFDDTEYEPTVLPARFPNLLVNGATGISAGYATEIPTHNLDETIQATIYLMKHPEASLEELMQFIKGPDFPTGGILQGLDGIKKAYETGRGRAMLRAKTEIEALRGGKSAIVVTEIPYEVNKAVLVKKIDEIRLLKKVEGIAEVRDESDRDGLRIVIELKKNSNAEGILNYLFKNTDLQISYNFNMVAIDHMRPKHVGLKQILTSYLEHQRTVTTKRTEFDLDKAKQREHIVVGLIKALSILDQVIKVIRASKNRKDATKNLVQQFDFTDKQADAIVALQLYRLTNTDMTELEKEAAALKKAIAKYEKILSDPKELDKVIRQELQMIAKKYASPRKTEIQAKIASLKIETEVLVAQEDVIVQISREGYVKRSSLRSFNASDANDNGLREDDEPVLQTTVNTLDHLFIFTNKGNVIYRPVHEITEARFKDTGEHLSQTVGLDADERVIFAKVFKSLDEPGNFVFATKEGFIKQTALVDLKPGRTYKSRASRYITLKTPTDEVISLYYTTENKQLVCVSYNGYGLRYDLAEVPTTGARAAGVKCMDLRDDTLVAVLLADEQSALGLLTTRGSFKKMKVTEIPLTSRARRGVQILRELKSKPHRVFTAFLIAPDQRLEVMTATEKVIIVEPNAHNFNERYSNGSYVFDAKTEGEPQNIRLYTIEETETE